VSERAPDPYGDPNTYPFWDAARTRRLLIQRCTACGANQFYPRPFCLRCQGGVEWVEASGHGVVYAQTEVHVEVPGGLPLPYTVAVVELDEGPRLMTHIVGGAVPIGGRVRVDWRDREGGLPPLFVFRGDGATT
jgi:uncharacterized OB-fold protein